MLLPQTDWETFVLQTFDALAESVLRKEKPRALKTPIACVCIWLVALEDGTQNARRLSCIRWCTFFFLTRNTHPHPPPTWPVKLSYRSVSVFFFFKPRPRGCFRTSTKRLGCRIAKNNAGHLVIGGKTFSCRKVTWSECGAERGARRSSGLFQATLREL